MFGLGFFGFLHELILSSSERPYLITASLALMGLPVILRADERRRDENGD